jgi:hypothetical protein
MDVASSEFHKDGKYDLDFKTISLHHRDEYFSEIKEKNKDAEDYEHRSVSILYRIKSEKLK